MKTLQKDIEEKLLQFVQGPSQYIGREMNMIRKDWDRTDVRVALGFPDTYSIGMASLAVQIIYHVLNSRDDTLCERVFCPWIDASDRMRALDIPLFSLESYAPIREFDIFALTVPYEMLYTNVLEMLDLAGIPQFSKDRTQADPLVVIGGSQVDNPEPIADFIDLAIIGDAEATLPEFIDAFKELKAKNLTRDAILLELARRFDYVYVPKFYRYEYNDDKTIKSVTAAHDGIALPVERKLAMDLDEIPFPTKPLVPFHDIVHDRINIEIMRGCPHVCRYCHEGYTRKPVRRRSKDKIIELAKEAFANTGVMEISLCSLSSADFPGLEELFKELNDYFAPKNVSIALPSLRVDKQLSMIPAGMSKVRKSPLTIALEAGSERLRKVIHKNIDLDNLKPAVLEAYKHGWRAVKLYFIAGLPGETDDDLRELVELAREIGEWRKEVSGRAAEVNTSIAFLVPKSQTPIQWLGQKPIDYFKHVTEFLRQEVRPYRNIKISFHDFYRSRLEAVFARGDRRLSAALSEVWKNGARFDSWIETFHYQRWDQAFQTVGIDPDFYANRDFAPTEILPWDHIGIGVKKDVLLTHLGHSLEDFPELRERYKG
jgi:radical SAM family uncharacterized protein